ncbi:MAG: HlyD family efflux transporter periplasmic adaptor subunit, partial [Clostridiales bacterium]|nr:HlyD family efflux transporter periplasmic adaptor subunit [Clostridiales bacterium]
EIDELVQVTLNGFTIGEGKAQVNLPYELYTLMDGLVDSSPIKVNSIVRRSSIIYQIKNVVPVSDYYRALEDREELYQTILLYKGLIEEPVYLSPVDGIIAHLSAQEKMALKKEDELLRLFHPGSFVLDVAVDELDILSLQPGQEGMATLDALTKAEFPVTVEKIYLLGNTSGGITNYTVSLSIRGDERLRSGMNGTVTLRVDEVSEAVLVPLAALMSDRGGNYVLLKGEGSQSPGIKTYIDVGLSDANFAAVLEGLQENDVVLVRGEQMPDQTRRNVPSFMNPGGGQRR